MVARACGYGMEDLLAIGFTRKEVDKWQRIASRYRRRNKPEPTPGPWLERYRKKVAEGWTWKSKRPDDVDPLTWERYQRYTSRCRCKGRKISNIYAYIKRREAEKARAAIPKQAQPVQKKQAKVERITTVCCKADISAIVERNRQIVQAKLREQGLSLPARKS